MLLQTFILTLLPLLALSACHVPPTFWCDNVAVSRECGVENACTQWKATQAKHKFNFTLLYETHCPYSQQYVVDVLYPIVYKQFGNYTDIELVPWGNARRKSDGGVECQHGQKECDGNRITSCVLHYVTDNPTQMEFVYCLEKNLAANKAQTDNLSDAKRQCFTQLGFDDALQQKIKACFNGALGDQLERDAERRTTSAAYPDSKEGVPWIAINDRSLLTMQSLRASLPELITLWVNQATPAETNRYLTPVVGPAMAPARTCKEKLTRPTVENQEDGGVNTRFVQTQNVEVVQPQSRVFTEENNERVPRRQVFGRVNARIHDV